MTNQRNSLERWVLILEDGCVKAVVILSIIVRSRRRVFLSEEGAELTKCIMILSSLRILGDVD
jgi:hypothetical protein